MPTKPKTRVPTTERNWFVAIFLILTVAFIGASVGLVLAAIINIPTWSPDKLYGSETTALYDRNQKIFTTLHTSENRIQVPLSKVPNDLIKAFVSTEDREFYKHHGLNPIAIGRAILVDLVTGSKAQGASTITQQLARAAFLSPEKQWERKIKEAVMAIQLENKYSKDEIMEFYVNRIYFGSGAWGVQTAAQTYFGKDVQDLSLAECAMLAGLVQRPTAYSPFRNYDLAKSRQKIVLNSMANQGYISQEEADQAYAQQLQLNKATNLPHQYSYCVDYIIDEADRILGDEGFYDNPQDAIFKGGLKIYTTIDPGVQQYAESIYADPSHFPSIKSKTGQTIQSAMVILDHHTGDVIALVGGRNVTQQRGFNRATEALRQPGSSFKPLVVYGPALEEGIGSDYVLDDAPVSYKSGSGTWSPRNYDGKYRGPITMRTAVQWSVNVYAVKLADQIGIKNGIRFAENLGITSLVKAGRSNDYNLSTALGGITKGVSPLQMASAYGAFANDGIYTAPYVISKIVDNSGNVIFEHHTKYKRVMKKETAAAMTGMLQNVVQAGTGTTARIPSVQSAGKTGTTQDDKDAWFVGYTPYYTAAVWMGYDKEETMSNTYGGSFPARIWKAVMVKAIAGKSSKTFSTSDDGTIQVGICKISGKLASPACPESDIEMKTMPKSEAPKEYCDLHELLSICPDSGKLATPYCPNPVSRSFLKNSGPGDPEAPPTQSCDIHSSPPANANTGSVAKKIKVLVCTDPRHHGQLYLANRPGNGEFGGCPDQYTQEVEVDNPDTLQYCPLSDHQVTR